jgi:thiol-disulfide isomerase/thioredoxin
MTNTLNLKMMFTRLLILSLFITGCTAKAPTEFSEKALNDRFYTIENKTIQLKDILESRKGEKVLINVWASWCKDCLVSIPKMKQLQADNPNVTYVFISSDRNMSAWKKALKKYKINGEHYFMKNGMDSDFGDFLNSNWIPRYLVVNENGFVDLFKATKITDKRIVSALKK